MNDILGAEQAERTFLEAWNQGRVPHAWLICGPMGVGKAGLAQKIARFVLVMGAEDENSMFAPGPAASLDVPDDHPVIRRMEAGGHADFRILEKGWRDDAKTRRRTEILADETRSVASFLSMTAAEGGWRVVIIDAADDMNVNAANALLKTLEEPPSNTLLLLVSHNPGRLLPTIRSRCRTLLLRPLPRESVEAIARRKIPDLSPKDAALAADMAEGSPGRALALLQGDGLENDQAMLALLRSLPSLDIVALHLFAERVSRDEAAFRATADLLLWRLAKGAEECAQGANGGEQSGFLADLAARVGLERWLALWDKLAYVFARTDAVNLDRKQVMINAFMDLERSLRS